MLVTINDRALLQEISGLADEAYDRWMTESMDDWDDPEWIEMAEHEVEWPEDSMTPGEHRRELRFLERFAAEWLQDKVDRLLQLHGLTNPLPRGWWRRRPLGQIAFADWLLPPVDAIEE